MHKFFTKKNNKACPQCVKHSFCRRGFTLVETLVGLSIFTFSMLALMSVLGSGVADINYAKQKTVAGYLAQEGIEHVRNMRDNSVLYNAVDSEQGWNEFKAEIQQKSFVQSYPVPAEDNFENFTRVLSADTSSFGNDEVEVFSTVSWTQGSGNYNVVFAENLFNWAE
ncbi:MAG TPA: type II secretion system protein [Candidatus Paceibacterota bacterium]|jgi:type II secretory pathway pseudopilin PulG|nr:type II secretion system protein [Candidatus Paceibacterota bacterium]